MALRRIADVFITLAIRKLPPERSASGNPRDFAYQDRVLKWAPHIPRDTLSGNMKAFEAAKLEELNPMWSAQEVSLPDSSRIALLVNRVKKSREVWKLEVDIAKDLVVSAELVAGNTW